MDLIEKLVDDCGGVFFKEEFRSIPTTEGVFKSQIVIGLVNHDDFTIKIIGNYQYGAAFELIKDSPPYSFVLISSLDSQNVNIFPRGWLDKLVYRLICSGRVKSPVKIKYRIKATPLTKGLIEDESFCSLLLKNNVYISTKRDEERLLIKMYVVQSVLNLETLKELYDIMICLATVKKSR